MQITTPLEDKIVIEALKRDMLHASQEYDELEANQERNERQEEEMEYFGRLFRACRTLLRYYLNEEEQKALGI